MAITNINFNNVAYQIDDTSLYTAASALRNHLSTVMNGTGATINFGGAAYNVDYTKLSAATNDFASHLATIAGNGHKVVVGGIEYYVDSNNVKNAFSELHANFANLAGIDTIEDLQNKYEFIYFSTLNDAVDAVNNGAVDSSVNKEDATAGVYVDENNVFNVVLLKDITLTGTLKPTVDMAINLGGHILYSTTGTAIQVNSGTIYINAKIQGSGINVKVPAGSTARAIAINKNVTVTIDGGTIYNESVDTTAPAILCLGTFNANNTTIISKTVSARADGISMSSGSTANINNCNIFAYSEEAKSYGVYVSSKCSVTITDSNIKGYAKYMHDGSNYTSCSMGIYHSANSTLTLNNCNVNGNIAGIQTYGTLYINGGVYEGYGHGGIYFTGTSTNSYIRNATIRECGMSEGYTNNVGTNHVGFYIGTGSSNSIYMDNCSIDSEGHAIVMRGSSGDSLYISNSRIGKNSEIRIDSTTQKLYIGVGNNFTADDTTLPDAVVQTNEVYIYSN